MTDAHATHPAPAPRRHAKSLFVADLSPGDRIIEIFAVATARQGQTKNGQPFWSLVLADASGSMPAKVWHPLSMEFPTIPEGSLIQAEGLVGEYRGEPQLTLDRLALLDPALVDPRGLIPVSPRPPEEMLEELRSLCKRELTYQPWRALTARLLGDEEISARLLAATGAKSVHHAYMGGLLEHTLSVAKLCLAFCAQYPHLDKEILLVAAVFHDLGKAWELSCGFTSDYTDEGRLIGHISIAMEVLGPHLAKCKADEALKTHLKHIILSHHGEYEFGSPRRPKTAEALALHYADNLDAKQNQLAGLFPDAPEEAEDNFTWSSYQPTLQRYVTKPPKTPAKDQGTTAAQKSADAAKDLQCSLLSKA